MFKKFFEGEELRHQYHLQIDQDRNEARIYAELLQDEGEYDLADYIILSLELDNEKNSEKIIEIYKKLRELKNELGEKIYNLPFIINKYQNHSIDSIKYPLTKEWYASQKIKVSHLRVLIDARYGTITTMIKIYKPYGAEMKKGNLIAQWKVNTESTPYILTEKLPLTLTSPQNIDYTFKIKEDCKFSLKLSIENSNNNRTYVENNPWNSTTSESDFKSPYIPFSADAYKGYGILEMPQMWYYHPRPYREDD